MQNVPLKWPVCSFLLSCLPVMSTAMFSLGQSVLYETSAGRKVQMVVFAARLDAYFLVSPSASASIVGVARKHHRIC